jgi:hypothetical protein
MCFAFIDNICYVWTTVKGTIIAAGKKGKHNGKWTVGNSVDNSVNCFAVFESSSFTFVGFSTKQVTLLAATSMILRFSVSRAMLKTGNF